jgi:hypothetical protein
MCGGLMSARWLGKIQPSATELNTLSLRKYMKMIDAWGGWNLFQDFHNVSIANVATNYIVSPRLQ